MSSSTNAPPSEPVRKARILIVDDEPDVLGTIRRCIFKPEYEIISTTDPLEAAQKLATQKFDVLLSDIDMPEMSGHELVAIARESCPGAVRIMVTGAGRMEAAIRAINEGEVHRYIEKPFSPQTLREVVAQGLTRAAELQRATEAARSADRRSMLMRALEAEHPGIGTTDRDVTGAYAVDVEGARLVAATIGLGPLLG